MTGTLHVAAFLAVTVAVAALLCGHHGQPWPLRGACAWLCGHLPAEQPSGARTVAAAAERRTEPHTPAWARTDKDAA